MSLSGGAGTVSLQVQANGRYPALGHCLNALRAVTVNAHSGQAAQFYNAGSIEEKIPERDQVGLLGVIDAQRLAFEGLGDDDKMKIFAVMGAQRGNQFFLHRGFKKLVVVDDQKGRRSTLEILQQPGDIRQGVQRGYAKFQQVLPEGFIRAAEQLADACPSLGGRLPKAGIPDDAGIFPNMCLQIFPHRRGFPKAGRRFHNSQGVIGYFGKLRL